MIIYHRIKGYNKIIIPEHNPIYYIIYNNKDYNKSLNQRSRI